MDQVIPKKIWQTYKTDYENLPDYAKQASSTWIDKNSEWEYNYLSDSDVLDFVKDNFGNEWLDIFNEKCPVGVMRADIWRVMTIYINGGIYTDLDTVCHVPINTWINSMNNKRVIINAEHEIHIQQWTFLSEPEHPVFGYMLDKMYEGFKDPDFKNPHFVHALTGPGIFTKSILEYMDLWEVDTSPSGKVFKSDPWAQSNGHKLDLINCTETFNNSKSAIEDGIYLVPSYRFFHNEVSTHLYGSQSWSDGRYDQWIVERDKII